jgi:hypothetical protein
MGRVWVLDLDANGTGAEMLPLDKVEEAKRASDAKPTFVAPKRRERQPAEPAPAPPPAPRRFRVTDVMSGAVLAEDASLHETVDVLKDVRSSVDVRVYVLTVTGDDWRLLTLPEQRALWALRDR